MVEVGRLEGLRVLFRYAQVSRIQPWISYRLFCLLSVSIWCVTSWDIDTNTATVDSSPPPRGAWAAPTARVLCWGSGESDGKQEGFGESTSGGEIWFVQV